MEVSHEQIAQLFETLLQKPIAFQRAFVDIAGNIPSALFLSQAWYWSSRTTLPGEWFYKTQEDWTEETGLTRYEQEAARKSLRNQGIIEEKKRGIPAKLYFHLNKNILQQKLLTLRNQGCHSAADLAAVEPHYNSEITPETTFGFSPIVPQKDTGDFAAEESVPYTDSSYSREEPLGEDGSSFVESLFSEGTLGKGREVSKGSEVFQDSQPLLTNSSPKKVLGSTGKAPELDNASEVLTYLNRVAQRNYRAPGQIAVRLSQGVTVEELTLVIDYLSATRNTEWKRDWFDQDAPFRKGNFDKNLEKAKAWGAKQRILEPSPSPSMLAPIADDALMGLWNDTITERKIIL